MTLFALLAVVVTVWVAAAVLWLLDAPRPTQTVDTILATSTSIRENIVEPLKVAA